MGETALTPTAAENPTPLTLGTGRATRNLGCAERSQYVRCTVNAARVHVIEPRIHPLDRQAQRLEDQVRIRLEDIHRVLGDDDPHPFAAIDVTLGREDAWIGIGDALANRGDVGVEIVTCGLKCDVSFFV